MFFDADSMALLAEIGAIELLQQKTAEHLKEEAARRRAERTVSLRSPSEQATVDDDDEGFTAPRRSNEAVKEALARVRRISGMQR